MIPTLWAFFSFFNQRLIWLILHSPPPNNCTDSGHVGTQKKKLSSSNWVYNLINHSSLRTVFKTMDKMFCNAKLLMHPLLKDVTLSLKMLLISLSPERFLNDDKLVFYYICYLFQYRKHITARFFLSCRLEEF